MDVYQRRRLVAVLAVVLVLVLAVVAIAGGGDDEGGEIEPVTGATSGAAAPLSKSEFIADGDQRCQEIATAIANIDSDDPQEAADEELDYTSSLLSQLRSLTPPEDDQATLDQFFSALEDLVAALKKNSEAIASGDTTAQSEATTETDAAKSEFLAAAQDYGFENCGEEGEPSTAVAGGGDPGDTSGGAVAPATPVEPTPTTPPPATTPPATAPSSGGTGGGTGGGGTGGGGGGGAGGGSSGGIGPG
jgi:ABC-type Na+ efflux pump permease subunit